MGSKFALDSNVLIYLLEDIEPYADVVEKLLRSFMRRENVGVISTVSVAEILTGFYASGDEKRGDEAKKLLEDLAHDGLEFVQLTFEIADLAAQLRARRGGRLPDALIVATAIEKGAEVVYSQDEDLQRFNEDIKVVKLV
ncbi:MAG: type II toxin-antitoxin system VapC family toxin [Candidatus Bathyarchaeia archaeon]